MSSRLSFFHLPLPQLKFLVETSGQTSRRYETMRGLPLTPCFPRLIVSGIMLCLTTLIPWGDGILLQAQGLEDLKKGVVKIIATVEGKNRVGAGIIVGLKPNLAYIATAAHVVAGDFSPSVVFYSQSTDRWESRVLGMDAGNPKGLAVLGVEGELLPDVFVLDLDPNFSIPETASLKIIGFPRVVGVPWASLPGSMVGRKGPDFVFSGAADEGNSGGPVLYQGKVVGLVMEAGNGFGNAVPSPTVRFTLEGWKVPLGMATRVAGGGKATPPTLKTQSQSVNSLPKTINGKDGGPMVLVPAGTFQMGSPDGEGGKDEHPQHSVSVNAFYLDTHEVTNQQFQQFVQANDYKTTGEKEGNVWVYLSGDAWKKISGASWRQPEGDQSVFGSGREMHPVVSISWEDAKAYCEGVGKRLPTEAEWEYAARSGGTKEVWAGTSVEGQLTEYAVYSANSGNRTASVGWKKPNGLGLYDMSGNVWEWVADWYDKDYYGNSPPKNPQGPSSSGEYKVLRGGSWYSDPAYLRSADRDWCTPSTRLPNYGVRCAQDAP